MRDPTRYFYKLGVSLSNIDSERPFDKEARCIFATGSLASVTRKTVDKSLALDFNGVSIGF